MQTLIRNGWIGAHPHHDLLIDGDRIEAVGPDLPAPDDGEVIDATGMLVLPGLVDTHRHTWQTVLRHRGADWSLGDYLDTLLQGYGSRYRPEDVYTGTLLGALAALDAGITTLVDWAHIEHTPQHTNSSILALRDAGIRAVFAHGRPIPGTGLEEAGRADLRRVREDVLADDGALVTLAMAAHGPDFTSPETAAADFALARELGIPITTHLGGGRPGTNPTGVRALHEAGLLGPDLTVVHGNGIPDPELAILADHGVRASISPQIELTMPGLGGNVAIRRMIAAGMEVGLSTDSETASSGDLFTQMRFALAVYRSEDGGIPLEPAEVLRMATGGAELVPGAAADVILVRATDLNLAPVSAPVDAVVLAAHPGNVDTVLVAGRVVKRDGTLLMGILGPERTRVLAESSAAYLLDRSDAITRR